MQWEDFLTHVLPYVQGCPDSVAVDHIRKAARIFCAKTLVWNYETDPVETDVGASDYVLQLGAGQDLVRLLAVSVDGREYTVPKAATGRRMRRQGDPSNIAFIRGPNEVVLNPAPWASGLKLLADVAVKPSLDAAEWPDDLAEHVTDIAHGAIATLCLLPRQDWTDANTAVTQQGLFNGRISTVAFKVMKGFGTGHQRARVEFC